MNIVDARRMIEEIGKFCPADRLPAAAECLTAAFPEYKFVSDTNGLTIKELPAYQYKTRIRETRIRKQMRLDDFAARLNTSVNTASRLESDKINVTIDWLNEIAYVLGVEPKDLLK